MKNLIFILFLSSVFLTFKSEAQIASRILVTQSSPRDTFPDNYTFIDNSPGAMNRWWVAKWDSVKIKPVNIRWINDSVIAIGDLRYAKLSGSYTDPSFIQSLSSSKVFGLSAVAISGNYSDLSGIPNMSLYYLNSNPNGYISGITGSMVTGALGYTPYDASNPSNYITLSALNPYLLKVDTTNKWLPISYVPTWTSITGKPSFVTVATTGSYHNLVDTPLITPTDISNWNTVFGWGNPSGVYVPLTRTLTINGITQDLNVNRSWTIPGTDTSNLSSRIDTKQNISDTNTVDATRYWVNTQGFLKGTDTISLSNRINTKFTIPTGTTGQYVRGDGSLASFPNIPAQYNPTAGTGISITGIYPNQTITNTSPFIPWVVTNNVSRSIVNVAAAANGFQISSSRNSEVRYSITISSTVSLSGSGTGYVVLEISPTNSSTASDWIEIGRVSSGQSGTLVIGLVLNQIGGGQICGTIPSGYYVRLRSVTIGGTPTYTYNSGQEVLQ